jgi:hypothetical protein
LILYLAEIVNTNDDKTDKEDPSSSFNNLNTPTPVRLFGQFKPNGTGFSNFGQLSSNGDNSSSSTPSYFTSTLSKISSTNGGGFGTSSTSLAASLAPLSAK